MYNNLLRTTNAIQKRGESLVHFFSEEDKQNDTRMWSSHLRQQGIFAIKQLRAILRQHTKNNATEFSTITRIQPEYKAGCY